MAQVYDCCNNSRPGSAGCWMKASVGGFSSFRGDVAGCSARGVVSAPSACCGGRPSRRYSVPPFGMRSAVALGPVGGGTLELRADGRLADWRMLNNQPRGRSGTKVSPEAAAFALFLGDTSGRQHATLLRTHSPEPGLPTVESMRFSGAFPATRLEFTDASLAQFAQSAVRLTGVSNFKMLDPNASNTPAISFAVDIPPSSAMEAAVMLSLPTQLLGEGTTVAAKDGRLVFSQSGVGVRQGQIVLSAGSTGAAASLSWGAAGNLSALVASFTKHGGQLSNTSSSGSPAHAAIAAKVAVRPGARTTLLRTAGLREGGGGGDLLFGEGCSAARSHLSKVPSPRAQDKAPSPRTHTHAHTPFTVTLRAQGHPLLVFAQS